MSTPPNRKRNRPVAANDNGQVPKLLGVEILIPQSLPIQLVEVEVFVELLESLGPFANDNEEPPP
jgi:hypothetical protein